MELMGVIISTPAGKKLSTQLSNVTAAQRQMLFAIAVFLVRSFLSFSPITALSLLNL